MKNKWWTIAQQLIDAADMEKSLSLFQQLVPNIVEQLQVDVRPRGPMSFWGRSHNFDELANAQIVDPVILQAIGHFANRQLSIRCPHAGLQHTYGYLFSVLKTPYGYKRDRWLETSIEDAFRLDRSTLSPSPLSGSLLANASWLSGIIGFRGHKTTLSRLKGYLAKKVPSDLHSVRIEELKHIRLVECVTTDWRCKVRRYNLQTDVVRSPHNKSLFLLVYSIQDSSTGKHVLVTMFPTDRQ